MAAGRVFVTGIGIISALGEGLNQTRDKLKNGVSGISTAKYLQSRYTNEFPFGEVDYSYQELIDQLSAPVPTGISRTSLLAINAVNQAIQNAALTKELVSDETCGFISASTVGGMTQTDSLHHDANVLGTPTDFLSSYNVGQHLNTLTAFYGMKGTSTVFNTACSSSANAIMFGTRLIKSGRAKRAIVGGSDALAKFTVNGFNALQILSTEPCRPFDENREGLNLGEGAAYLILESEDVVGDKKVYGEVTGYGNASDAHHPSAISDEAFGVIEAIEAALKESGVSPDQIDYVNAHGTGTQNNDQAELTGMNHIFNGKIPPFQSTKTYTGHTLAAAGVIEAVIALLAINHSELYPSLNCTNPIEGFNAYPITEGVENYSMNHVLSNSFGFAGNCSSLLLSKV